MFHGILTLIFSSSHPLLSCFSMLHFQECSLSPFSAMETLHYQFQFRQDCLTAWTVLILNISHSKTCSLLFSKIVQVMKRARLLLYRELCLTQEKWIQRGGNIVKCYATYTSEAVTSNIEDHYITMYITCTQ